MGTTPTSAAGLVPPAVWAALACPHCGTRLVQNPGGAACTSCTTSYPALPSGCLDLRLQGAKSVRINIEYSPAPTLIENTVIGPLQPKEQPEVDFSRSSVPWHLNTVLMSWFPRAQTGASLALDIGCGDSANKPAVECAGFTYVGLDVDSPDAMIRGDAHALPFLDGSIGFVLSIAVLEHLAEPGIALREVARVLQPGGMFLGSVSFLEPFHGDSYYHYTHLGVMNSLRGAGFIVERVAPVVPWHGLFAMARQALFPKMPAMLQRAAVLPVYALHRLWWGIARFVSPKATEVNRLLRTAGSFVCVARKAERPSSIHTSTPLPAALPGPHHPA